MIKELADKIKITTTNKKYWFSILSFFVIISVLPFIIIFSSLSIDFKFILTGITLSYLSLIIIIFHKYLLSAHEIVLMSIIEIKKQEDDIEILKQEVKDLQFDLKTK